MLLAGMVAGLATYSGLTSAQQDIRPVAVVTKPAPPGTRVADLKLRFVDMVVPEGIVDGLVTSARLSHYRSHVLAERIEVGELLSVADIKHPRASDGLRAMSLPVPPERAAGGTLEIGDRVDVISVAGGASRYVAHDLEVLDVHTADGSALGIQGETAVTVAVDERAALELAAALEAGAVHVLRATGATPTSNLPPVPVVGADTGPGYVPTAEADIEATAPDDMGIQP